MEIRRSGSQPSGNGPAAHFTGAVRIDPLFGAPEPARVIAASGKSAEWMERVTDEQYAAGESVE